MIEGRTRAARTAVVAAAACSTSSKYAAMVTVSMGLGCRRTVADTITPRVPSEPVNKLVRSRPATPLAVRRPVWINRPSASTTLRPRTESPVTPYLTHRRPPALVAMLPPMVEIEALAGSGA